jgi:hypothetical protein
MRSDKPTYRYSSGIGERIGYFTFGTEVLASRGISTAFKAKHSSRNHESQN